MNENINDVVKDIQRRLIRLEQLALLDHPHNHALPDIYQKNIYEISNIVAEINKDTYVDNVNYNTNKEK